MLVAAAARLGRRRAEDVEHARQVLFAELGEVIAAKGYALEPGAAIAKLNFMYGALIDRPVESLYRAGNELLVLGLNDLAGFDRTHPGAGLFFEARVDALADLVAFVSRKDQTLTAHGFSGEELTAFARSLQGRGIDRIVQFGDALSLRQPVGWLRPARGADAHGHSCARRMNAAQAPSA